MNKEIVFNPDVLEDLKRGVDLIANTVKKTLGPKGRNIIIENAYGAPHITKDGVTVAKHINVKDSVENLAVEILKQAAVKTVSQCGDGTTTSLVLSQALFNEAIKYIKLGVISPIELKKGLEKEVKKVYNYIVENATKIETEEQLTQVASISANNDNELGKLISEAFSKVGENGVVFAEESKSSATSVSVSDGAVLDRGYISPYFITNPTKQTVEFENPYILIHDKKIRAASDIIPILNAVAQKRRPLLIIAEEVEAQALSTLVINKVNNTIQVAAIKTPGFGERRQAIIEDLAILTKGKLISESTGCLLDKTILSDLGQATKIIISKTDTTIIVDSKNEEAIKRRIEQIRAESENSDSSYVIQKNKERVAMLDGKVATIHIGAHTEIELKEKRDRVDDAIQAAQAAKRGGIVPGGGSVFFNATSVIDENSIAGRVLCSALEAPLKTICENANVSFEVVANGMSPNMGYNALTHSYEDLKVSGVIDPAEVLLNSLENAVSVVNMLILTDAAVTIPNENKADTPSEDIDPQGLYDV